MFLRNVKSNIRFFIYLIGLIGLVIYIIFFIDSIRFYNLKKTFLKLKKSVELEDFGKVFNSISPDNALNAKLEIIGEQPYLALEGFEKVLINKKNSILINRKGLHPSLSLSLFSMGYASEFLCGHYKNGILSDREVDILENIYLFFFKEIINPFSLNTMSVNDHAISERIQFITLFSTFIKKYYPEKKELLNALAKDFNICLGFLLDGKFFKWQTNHGIMQLRSQAQIAGVIKNDSLKKNILAVFDKRLTDIIPYYIGSDGATYEAASEYWIYIYHQFTKITEIKAIENLRSVEYLKNELHKVKRFIQIVATNDGFLQGLGDGYSTQIIDTLKEDVIPQNRYFHFSNELVGANWSVDNINFNLLYVSLHTPPNVHKLPEDLAVYLYVNQPVFSNTGAFSYDKSKERMFFLTEKSQSTVSFLNPLYNEPIASKLNIVNFRTNEKKLSVSGVKYYKGNKSITRLLDIDPPSSIQIKDCTEPDDSLVAYYNVHPRIKIIRMSTKQVLLQTVDSIKISFISNCNIDIIPNGIISERKEEITKIKRLKITGNPIEVSIDFPAIKPPKTMDMIAEYSESNHRSYYTKNLDHKYKNINYNEKTIKLVLYKSFPGIFLLLLIVIVNELYVFSSKKKSERMGQIHYKKR